MLTSQRNPENRVLRIISKWKTKEVVIEPQINLVCNSGLSNLYKKKKKIIRKDSRDNKGNQKVRFYFFRNNYTNLES